MKMSDSSTQKPTRDGLTCLCGTCAKLDRKKRTKSGKDYWWCEVLGLFMGKGNPACRAYADDPEVVPEATRGK